MDIANMYELLNMIHNLDSCLDDEGKPHEHKNTVEDFCFNQDGKSIWVRLSNGTEYRFNVK